MLQQYVHTYKKTNACARVIVDSEADEEKIEKLKRLAEERCPAVYCLTNPVKLTIDLVRG